MAEISGAMREYIRSRYAPTAYAAQLLDALEEVEAERDKLIVWKANAAPLLMDAISMRTELESLRPKAS